MMVPKDVRTGRQIALLMQRTFPGRDWIGDMAGIAGQPRDTVEWHLQEDMEPPPSILQAAEELAAGRDYAASHQSGHAQRMTDASDKGDLPRGNVSPDDLPFAGVPGFIGKLRKGEDER